MMTALLAMVMGTRATTCDWCGRWVLWGYRIGDRTFCNSVHYHRWLDARDTERFDDERG
jgi:hypothetical protein